MRMDNKQRRTIRREAVVTDVLGGKSNHLFISPPFTGKTTLCDLFQEKLKEEGVRVIRLDFCLYEPVRQDIAVFVRGQTGWSVAETERTGFEYVLMDDLHRVSDNLEHIKKMFGVEDGKAREIRRDHQYFHGIIRLLMQSNAVILAFTAFPGISSSFSFPFRRTDLAFLNEGEMEELCGKMERKMASAAVRRAIAERTLGHVGYTVEILERIEREELVDEGAVLAFLGSSWLLEQLADCRPVGEARKLLGEAKKQALQEVCDKYSVYIYATPREAHSDLIMEGWVVLDTWHHSISFICPLAKQLVLFVLQQQGS